jgi:hypothetical protein
VPTVIAPRRGPGLVGTFAIALVAAAIVLVAALFSLPYWPDEARAMWRGPAPQTAGAPTPPPPSIDVAAEIDAAKKAMAARIDDLDKRVRALGDTVGHAAAPAPTPTPDDALDKLRNRIEALENKPAPAPATPADAGVDKDLAALRIEIATLRSGLQALGQTVAGQKDQARALAETVEKTRAQSSRMSADEKKALAAARASALIGIAARLSAALEAEQPFAADVALLAPLAKDDPKIAEQSAILRPLAEKGVASRAALAASFPAMAKAALADDVADDSIGERVLGRIRALVSLRRVGADVPGDSAEARLARAEAALQAGDLAKAVDLVKSLPPQTARATSAWLERASAHLAAQRAVDGLAAEGVALLGAAR